MPNRLVSTVRIGDKDFDYGSDIHFRAEGLSPQKAAEGLACRFAEHQSSAALILPGDLYHAESSANWRVGLDTSRAINLFLHELRKMYQTVLYVPGNHCLRRESPVDDPWADIDPPRGVIMPRGTEPVIETVGGRRILLANLFYDGNFIEGHPLNDEDFERLIDSTTDGNHLLRGGKSVEYYRRLTQVAAQALTPDIDAMVTHVPPHPSSATWRVNGHDDPNLPGNFEGQIVSLPQQDEETAALWRSSPDHVRHRLNAKSAMLGSNIFDPRLGAQPRDGLTVIFGHHHRDEDRTHRIGERDVRFLSHQRVQKG